MRRALLLTVLVAAPLAAQTSLPADAALHAAPNGAAIGTLKRGAAVTTGRASAGWTMVTVEGWVASTRLATRRDTLDRTVTGRGMAPLRAADGPTQRILAELDTGTLLKRLSDRNGWTRVRRSAWVRTSALQASSAGAARGGAGAATGRGGAARGAAAAGSARGQATPPTTSQSPPPTPPAAQAAAAASSQRAVRPTTLRGNPGGDERASIRAGVSVETLARDGGWARVRIEGWIPERDLAVSDSAGEAQLSAADLRANPAAHRGKVVRWPVQVVSLQRADALRPGMTANEPYLLARGPGDEGAILYLAVPQNLVDQARAVPPLTEVTVTVRVRDGRSAPVGAPLLDLISIARIQ